MKWPSKPCCDDCADRDASTVARPLAARHNATTGRYATDPPPPDDSRQFGRSFDRNYDVQAFTGSPVSTVPAGQWNRGILYRAAMPTLRLTSMGPMFDRTDARTWPNRVG